MSYVPLRVRSRHSIHLGASSIEALVRKATRFGAKAIALTDESNLYGAVEFFEAAPKAGVKPVLGARLTTDRARATLLVTDARGYANLCRLISARNLDEGFDLAAGLEELHGGLFLLLDDPVLLERLARGVGPENLRAEIVRPSGSEREERALFAAAKRAGVKPVASSDVFFAEPGEFELHEALVAIGENRLLDEVHARLDPRRAAYLRSPEEMQRLFRDVPEALAETVRVAEACEFDLLGRKPVFPKLGADSAARLRREAERGARRIYAKITPFVRRRLERELDLIIHKGFADYFLVVADIVRHARSLGTPVAGRGSGASSLVAYSLGITNVDPLRYNLPFERFLNERRADFPDLDVDFCWRLRDDVIGYVFERYGETHVAMVSCAAHYRARGSVREGLKLLGVPERLITKIASRLGTGLPRRKWGTLPAEPETVERAVRLARLIEGCPRCISVHCGGVVITPDPISHHAPLQRAEKGVVIVQYDKDAVRAVGLVKLDLLGNRALTNIAESARLSGVDTEGIPEDDAETAVLLAKGDTLGVNQLESPAMRRLLTELAPTFQKEKARGLMQVLALIRPGAASLGMKETFVRRARGIEPVPPLDPRIDSFLKETHGVMVYEDDALLVAAELAGLDPARADRFRRAVTKCRSDEERLRISRAFLSLCERNGAAPKLAADLWVQMAKFNSYSFCRAHAASYARLAWQNAYMKAHHPAEFWIGALSNNQGLYDRWVYAEEARRTGVKTLPPCVNHSDVEFTLERDSIRTGLGIIKGLSRRAVDSIVNEARKRPFEGLVDLLDRTRAGIQETESLVRVGALDFTGRTRPELLWELRLRQRVGKYKKRRPRANALLFETGTAPESNGPCLGDYPEMRKWRDEWMLTGLSFRWHPVAPFRRALEERDVQRSSCLHERIGALKEQRVRIAGLLATARLTHTSRNRQMLFLTLSDEDGLTEVVAMPAVYARLKFQIDEGVSGILIASGRAESNYGALNLMAESVTAFRPRGTAGHRGPATGG